MKSCYKLSLIFQIMFYSILNGLSSGVLGQDKKVPPAVQALSLIDMQTDKIHLDGILSEQVWQRAAAATGFRQREPYEGEAATEKTEIRVIFDEHTLFIGLLAHDQNPDRIIARMLQRDKLMRTEFDGKPVFAGDDAVAILLDPFHDHRNAVVFATNPNGAEFEALITEEGREFNIDWRTVWQVAAQRIPEGWSAEFAIPFRTLRYPSTAEEHPWGFNIYRIIRHKNEEVLWSAWSRDNEGFARVSRAGHLNGMVNLPRPSFNIEFKPFALTGITKEQVEAPDSISSQTSDLIYDTDRKINAGFDAKWEVRPGLLLDLTFNTDFAQVEVDDEQVNLTRFDLFFPEKRDFFLENAGIFEFGFRSFFEPPPFLLFFSRQIGITEFDDEIVEVPVFGGARLSGRIGKQTIGLLNMITEAAYDEPSTNFTVARVKRDVGSGNYIGVMLTDKRSKSASNTTTGLDWSFWPTSKLNIQGFVAHTFTSGEGGDDYAYRLGMDYQTNRFGFNGQHLTVGPEANAEIGFIIRDDIRRTNGLARLTVRPKFVGLRMINFFWSSTYITRLNFEIQDWNSGVAINPEWDSGESLVLFLWKNFTRLDEGFDLTDNVTVPGGDYNDLQFGWFFNTSNNRSVSLHQQGIIQSFFDGCFFSLSNTLNMAFGSNMSLSLGFTHNKVDVPGGSFNADLASLRFSYAFSTRLVANALIQYNDLDNKVSTNIRLNYIHRPGSDLFIVYNEEYGSDASLWDLDNRGLAVKLTYLQRL